MKFEKIWKEYIDTKKAELRKGSISEEMIEVTVYEKEERKEEFMDFYTFLKLKEDI